MNLNTYVVIVIIRLDSKLTLPSTILVWSMFAPKLRVIRGSTGMIRIKFLMLQMALTMTLTMKILMMTLTIVILVTLTMIMTLRMVMLMT